MKDFIVNNMTTWIISGIPWFLIVRLATTDINILVLSLVFQIIGFILHISILILDEHESK